MKNVTIELLKNISYRGKSFEDRFWSKVKKGDGCWIWTGCKRNNVSNSYGSLGTRGIHLSAHRVSWMLYFGKNIPEGMCVLHKCDVPSCVNPSHLFIGTKADNNWDKSRKGRWRGKSGEEVWNSKLYKNEVEQIRLLYRDTDITQKELSWIFGVSETMIRFIINGKWWKGAGGPIGIKKDKNRHTKGEFHRSCKLTSDEVIKIRDMYANGVRIFNIHKQFPVVSKCTISAIVHRKHWKHI